MIVFDAACGGLTETYTSMVRALYEEGPGTFITAPRGMKTVEFESPVSLEVPANIFPAITLPGRRLNPFFAIFEALWMWGIGSNDVEKLALFNEKVRQYSDDGKTFHGAYGWRLMRGWSFNQIEEAIALLRCAPDTRQCVLTIWDPPRDLRAPSKDIPCNIILIFRVRHKTFPEETVLDCTVMRRSNDIILGLPHNVIQFWFLHNIVATSVGLRAGTTTHVVNSMHLYTDSNGYKLNELSTKPHIPTPVPVLRWEDIECDLPTFKRVSSALFRSLYFDGRRQFSMSAVPEVEFDSKMYHKLLRHLMVLWNVYTANSGFNKEFVMEAMHSLRFNDIRFLVADFMLRSKHCTTAGAVNFVNNLWNVFSTEVNI